MIDIKELETIGELIEQSLQEYQSQVFAGSESYSDLQQSIFRIHESWEKAGIRPEHVIVIHINDRLLAVKSLLAALTGRLIPVLLHADTSDDLVAYFVQKVQADYYVHNNGICCYNPDKMRSYSSEVGLIACTSGTTGLPNMVVHSHRSILENISGILSYMSPLKEDRLLILRDPSYLSVITGEILVALSVGARIAFVNQPVLPNLLVKQMIDECITIAVCASSLIHLSLSAIQKSSEFLGTLRMVKLLGEGADQSTITRLKELIPHTEIFHCYGLTEVGPRVTFWASKIHPETAFCVGEPLPKVRVRITNDQGKEVPCNEPGYVEVSSPSLMIGYVGEKKLQDEWLRTGDWGWVDHQGYVYIQCRYDQIIIRGGVKIPIVLIESALQAHEEIEGALVTSREVSPYKITIEALVVPKKGSQISENELLKWCRNRLSHEMWPQRIRLVDNLPVNKSGKKDRRVKPFGGDAV